jgi:nucleotide-binding universal stress UspA family protein
VRTGRRILHPTDFSDASRAAFRRALALCRRRRAELVLLHVLPTSMYELDAIGWPPGHEAHQAARRRSAHRALAALVTGARRRGVRARAVVVEGVPHRAITGEAASLHPDLIVMGIHGGHGIWGLLFGGTAASVIARAKCPVLTVRAAARAAEPLTHAGLGAA